MALVTIDVGAIIKGKVLPGTTAADQTAKAYRAHLFGEATLQDLPSDTEGPRFVINATNVQTKVLWRFSKPFMGDYSVGLIKNPTLALAKAVAASSGFPPFLSPLRLAAQTSDFDPTTNGGLQYEPYTTRIVLTDGGVYDNLGLETVWKEYDTVLVSDGGGSVADEPKPSREWLAHTYRVLNIINNQVGSLRKRAVVASYQMGLRQGTYWGMRTDIANYQLPNALPCPYSQTIALANTPTRLRRLDGVLQERIINWGYAVCDAAIRRHVDTAAPPPANFPYPAVGVG